MRRTLLTLALVAVMAMAVSAQDGKLVGSYVYTGPSFKIKQSITTVTLTISADGTITIHKALDPQTVLCIEKPDPPSYTISGGKYLLWNGQTIPAQSEEQKLVVEKKPPIPARVCKTVEAWLEGK